MKRFLVTLQVFLACASALCGQEMLFQQAPGPTHPKDKTRIEVEALFSMPPPSGYLPVRVRIVNQRTSAATIKLSTKSSNGHSYSDAGSEVASSFRMDAEAESNSSHDILVPLSADYDRDGVNAVVEMTGSFGYNSGNLSSNYSENFPAVLMSEALYTPNSSRLDSELNGSSTHRYGGSHSFAARFEPTKMPEDWRAYSGYDQMILTVSDWTKITPGARNAILKWCRLGGAILICSSGGGSANWSSLGIDVSDSSMALNYGYGRIESEGIPANLQMDAAATIDRFLHPQSASRDVGSNITSILSDYSNIWPLHKAFREGKAEFEYGIFVVVLVIFGVLVGPVNLFVFAKSGRRHRLFITTPIISLAASALLILLILVKDGVGGRGIRMTLMEVRPDQKENTAYMVQEQVSRTGVLLGQSFAVKEEAYMTPVPIQQSPWARLTPYNGGGGARYSVEFADGDMKVSGDWFQSRSEQGQLIKSVMPTRGQIQLTNSAGPPKFMSRFEFPLEALYFKDSSGGYWKSDGVNSGSTTTAESISKAEYETTVATYASKFGKRHRAVLLAAAERVDHFVAFSKDAPAVETFDSIDWAETGTIITGPIVR